MSCGGATAWTAICPRHSGRWRSITVSAAAMYRAAFNVSGARKALKTQACPGIGRVRGSAAIIVNGEGI